MIELVKRLWERTQRIKQRQWLCLQRVVAPKQKSFCREPGGRCRSPARQQRKGGIRSIFGATPQKKSTFPPKIQERAQHGNPEPQLCGFPPQQIPVKFARSQPTAVPLSRAAEASVTSSQLLRVITPRCTTSSDTKQTRHGQFLGFFPPNQDQQLPEAASTTKDRKAMRCRGLNKTVS